MSDIQTSDEELEALMAELEAQNAEVIAQKEEAAVTTAEPEPEVISEPEPEVIPEPVKAVEPEPVKEPAPEPQFSAAEVVEDKKIIAGAELRIPPRPTAPATTAPAASKPSELLHYVDVDQFRGDTRITESSLDQCMIEQNGLRAYYGAQAARAESQASRLKAKFDVVEATLYDHHRRLFAASGEKVTEKAIENAVKLDPRWLKTKNLVIDADTIASINKGLVESLRDRKDMLVQLGADRREEFKGGVRIMESKVEHDDLRSRALQSGLKAGVRTA